MTETDGSTTDYTYTPLGQIATETDYSGLQYSSVTSYTYDAMGNIVAETVTPADGTSSLTTKFSYDAAGRQTSRTDNSGGSDATANRTTTIAHAPFDGIYNTATTTYPDGSTSIEKDYLDGSVASIGGTAEVATSYSYGVVGAATPDGDGNTIAAGSTYVTSSTDNGANTTTNYTNVLGQQYLSVESAPSGEAQASPGQASTVDSRTIFDGNDRPTQTINFDGSKSFSVYDPSTGQLGATWTSMDGSSTFNSSDSKTLYCSSYGSSSSTVLSASGNQTDQVSYTNGGLTTSENLNGLTTSTNLVMDGGGKYHITTANPDGTSQKDSYTSGLLSDSQQLTTGATPTVISDTSFYYNPNRTLQYSTDYTGVTNYKEFQDGTQQAVQLPGQWWQTVTGIDQGTEDPTNVTNPDNTTTKQTENPMGQTATQSGAGVIASKLGYNADGQLNTLTTYPGGDPTNINDAGAATTTWGFDSATGLTTNKSYANGSENNFKYNSAGQLKTMTEPGMSGSFGYNPAGQQTSYTATDQTTGLVLSQVLAEDDQGRAMVTMSLDNGQISSESNTYTALGQPLSESFGAAGNTTVAHGYYPLRPAQGDPTAPIQSPDALAFMTIQNLPSGQANAQTTYGYDPSSKRLQTIRVNGVTFTIGYVQGSSGQIGSITATVAGQAGNALTTTFAPSGSNASLLGTITATTGGGSQLYWASLGYNANQQINSDLVIRTNTDGTQATDNYGYTYGTGPGDNTNDANSLTKVTDNGTATETYSYDGVGNFLGTSLGDVNNLNQYAALSYNLRGDVTNDGTYAYTFDANDRMISVTPDNPASGGDKLTYGYDSQGRRIWKDVYVWNPASNGWQYSYARHYVYDGMDLVGELDQNNVLLTGYTWGPNGELLAVTDYTQATPKTYEAIEDASDDTAMLVDLTNDTIGASYTYDSYGNLLTATGPVQAICSILGKRLQYDFEARSIGHALNRDTRLNIWLERDPAGEIAGGANLYQYLGGDPIDLSDASGLAPGTVGTDQVTDEAVLEVTGSRTTKITAAQVSQVQAVYEAKVAWYRARDIQVVIPPAPNGGPTMGYVPPTTGQVVKQYVKEVSNAANNNVSAVINLPATVINNQIYASHTGYTHPVFEHRSEVYQLPMIASQWQMDYIADPNADKHLQNLTSGIGATFTLFTYWYGAEGGVAAAQGRVAQMMTRDGNIGGPVVFRVPSGGATEAEIAQARAYVVGSNEALDARALSPTGRVSTSGALRDAASDAARLERARASAAGTPYLGHAGHVPDTTWTGRPQPYSWLDLSPNVNTSLGSQAARYPIKYKPTVFILEEAK